MSRNPRHSPARLEPILGQGARGRCHHRPRPPTGQCIHQLGRTGNGLHPIPSDPGLIDPAIASGVAENAGISGRESLLAADRGGLPEWGPDQHPHSPPTSFHTASTVSDESTSVPSISSSTARQVGTWFAAGELPPQPQAPVRQQPPATWPVEGPPRWPRTRQVAGRPAGIRHTPPRLRQPTLGRRRWSVRQARNNSGTTFAIPKPVDAEPRHHPDGSAPHES